MRQRPVIWRPRFATRRMREQAWAKSSLQRETAVARTRRGSWLRRWFFR